jgi:ribosomal protein S11
MKKTTISKKKKRDIVPHATLRVFARPNNTILSLCKLNGDVLNQVSCGSLGFKNCRKSTPYATQSALKHILGNAVEIFMVKQLDVIVRGLGLGRESVLTHLQSAQGIEIISIQDITNPPYGGVRCRRARRV